MVLDDGNPANSEVACKAVGTKVMLLLSQSNISVPCNVFWQGLLADLHATAFPYLCSWARGGSTQRALGDIGIKCV